jgi:periplasmic copper chaperone A
MSRNRIRLLGGAAVAAVAIVASAGAASAHVSVNPDTATQGGFTKLTFRVPNETDTASTTKVSVSFPADQPLGSVSVKPHPGWTSTVTKTKLTPPIKTDDGEVTEAVSAVTWTAASADSAIKPGEFDEFDVSAGPLPEAESMQFKALQTYSDGEVVRWIDPANADGSEPEHPAPTLALTPATAEGTGHGGTEPAAEPSATTATSSSSDVSQGSVNTAIALAIAALLVGLIAAALGVVALRRRTPANQPRPEELNKV